MKKHLSTGAFLLLLDIRKQERIFLLLSDEELDSKQVKHFIHGAANSVRICFEDKLAFPIEWIEERHTLKQLVHEKVMNVHE